MNETEILEIIINHPDVEASEINTSTNLRENLGLDSLTIAEITLEIEDTYKFRFPEDAIKNIITVGDIVNYTQKLKLN